MILFTCIVYLLLSIGLIQLFYSVAQHSQLIDKPNERSMHLIPTVRGAGIVFIGLSLLALFVFCYLFDLPLQREGSWISSILLLASVSFFDDLYQLTAKTRFLVQG